MLRNASVLLLLAASWAPPLAAQDLAWYDQPLAELDLESIESAGESSIQRSHRSGWTDLAAARAVVDGGGEAYLVALPRAERAEAEDSFQGMRLVVQAPAGQSVTGRLFLDPAQRSDVVPIYAFELKPEQAQREARAAFLQARHVAAKRKAGLGWPGAAWFRHVAAETEQEASALGVDVDDGDLRRPRWRRSSEVDDSYLLFTGGRAISENLALDRVLAPGSGEATVPLDEIPGITVRELDWEQRTAEMSPELDPLASWVPEDCYGVFFPSFTEFVRIYDAVLSDGVSMWRAAGTRAEDAFTFQRYEKQLAVPLDSMARQFGPQVIQEMAATGHDPYLRTGSDVAMLFRSNQVGLLESFLRSSFDAAAFEDGVESWDGEVAGRAFTSIRNRSRSVCSYLVATDDTIVVSNSLALLERVLRTGLGGDASLADSKEYVFFRDRYARDEEESAFVMLTDAMIRRLGGPRWRIGDARRTHALALVAEQQAQQAAHLVAGTAEGAASTTYGGLGFQTPIVELDFDKVTEEEKRQYLRFRDFYQRNWRRFFDPIGGRAVVRDGRLELDVSILPLTLGSDYQDWIDLTVGSELAVRSGDPHADALLHLAVAMNPHSSLREMASNFGGSMIPGVDDPLAWIGDSATVYADDDPYWLEMLAAEDRSRFLRDEVWRIPVGVQIDSRSPMKLAAFLAGLRAFVEQSAPGLTLWSTEEHAGRKYVRISPTKEAIEDDDDFESFQVYYASLPDRLILTMNEGVIHRALERLDGEVAAEMPEWIGTHVALRAERGVERILEGGYDANYGWDLRRRCWENLSALNEWRRLWPASDPLAAHEKLWHTRPVCPETGAYDWNDPWRTMSCSYHGHPGDAHGEGLTPRIFASLLRADFGLTFEDDGVRARVRLNLQDPDAQD